MPKPFRSNLKRMIIFAAVAVVLLAALLYKQFERSSPGIKIGVLHSLSGSMAESEAPLVDVIRLSVEQTNRAGGLNGRQIEMIVADCRSEAAYCAQEAERLITREDVKALFGCWTTACRKAVKQVVERHHHLLFYPLRYEGLEESTDTFYTGAVPNQQIVPAVMWAMQNGGKRFYLLGSGATFPRIANYIAHDVVQANGGQVLGERYLVSGEADVAAAVREIAGLKPDVVLSAIDDVSDHHFLTALSEAGMSAEHLTVISTGISMGHFAGMNSAPAIGSYRAWSYFQSIDSVENKAFIAQFKNRFGQDRVLNDPMESAHIAINMWINAVREAGSVELPLVKLLLGQQSLRAPEGVVSFDFTSNHLWRKVRIGRVRSDGQIDLVWQSPQLVRPIPFPDYRARSAWESVLVSESIRGTGAWP